MIHIYSNNVTTLYVDPSVGTKFRKSNAYAHR